MAILKNLIVNGASRFLGKTYFQDVQIGGSATLSSLSLSGNLSVTGTSTFTGAATFSNTVNATGNITSSGNLYANGGYLYLQNKIAADGGKTTANQLTINGSNAFTVGTYIKNNLKTDTLNATNVNVSNNLHATHFDLQTVAQLGGSFYVSPTLKFPNSGATLGVAKSGSTLTLTITDSSITSTNLAGIVWTVNSKVKVSGNINGVVTGTMDGTITGINPGSNSGTLTISCSGENSGSVVAGSYSASQFSDLSVMVYQRKDSSNDYRVGIWMNCYDLTNSSATIRVYGGTSASPNVMLGNLTNAGLGTVNNITPDGWGLYAQNAFLWGAIVSTEGQIGGFTIGDSTLSNGTFAQSGGVFMSTGKTASNAIGGSSGSNTWAFTAGNTFGVTTAGKIYASDAKISGEITATSGTIGGVTANNSYGLYTNSKTSATSTNTGFLISKDGAIYLGAYNSTNQACPFQVTNAGFLTATSGKIGGWNIGVSSLYSGTHSAYNSNVDGIFMDSTYIAGGKQAAWYLKNDGSAKIGAMTLSSDGTLSVPAANIGGLIQHGTCNTTSTYQTKDVSLSGFVLYTGAIITIQFTNANTYKTDDLKLNVNSTGAKSVYVNDVITSTTNRLFWGANTSITFRYNGEHFDLLNNPKTWYGTSDTQSSNSFKQVAIDNCVICKGTVAKISMKYENTASNLQLAINNVTGIEAYIYAGADNTICPTTSNGFGWTPNSNVEFVFDGKYWRMGDTSSLDKAINAAKTATNYISTINNTGIKVSYATNSTNYLQITADGINIFKNNNPVANYSDTITLGRVANGVARVQIDDNSLDVISRNNSGTDKTIATFGAEAVIGDMSARGVSINSDGFKFNSDGKTAFYIGIDNRSGSTASEVTGYTFPSNPEIKYINSIPYYLLTTISSDKTVIEVGVYAEMADPEAESRIFYDWVVDDNKLYINCDEVDQKYDAAVDFVSYIYTTNTNTQTPYCMIGDNAYSSSNPAGTMSFAQGCKCLALGAYSTSVGWETLASGTSSFSLGKRSEAHGAYSFAGGALSTSNDFVSFAYGYKSNAWGKYSVAFGNQDLDTWIFEILITSCDTEYGDITCRITQNAEIFEDYISAGSILVSTDNQYIFEDLAVTSGSGTSDITFSCSLYGGHFPAVNSVLHVRVNPPGSYGNGAMSVNACCASGISSTALGIGTTAYTGGSLAIGTYNIPESNVLFSIGNGTMLENHNAMTVDMFGNVKATKFQGEQKILWQGSHYMAANQNAELSELVSAQANGIVLVWSGYTPSTSTVQNYQWHFDFIPKWLVAVHPGAGVTCIMAGATFNPVAAKYVYIDNDKIRGYTNNSSTSGTTHGITWQNTYFVLRYVIGV